MECGWVKHFPDYCCMYRNFQRRAAGRPGNPSLCGCHRRRCAIHVATCISAVLPFSYQRYRVDDVADTIAVCVTSNTPDPPTLPHRFTAVLHPIHRRHVRMLSPASLGDSCWGYCRIPPLPPTHPSGDLSRTPLCDSFFYNVSTDPARRIRSPTPPCGNRLYYSRTPHPLTLPYGVPSPTPQIYIYLYYRVLLSPPKVPGVSVADSVMR